MRPVVVIGGGISGLSAAYYLTRAGLPVTLVESQNHLGGVIRTELIEGCVVELGPDSFLSMKPWAAELIREVGLGDEIIGSNDSQRATYIWKNGRMVRMPEGMMLMVPARVAPVLFTGLFGPWTKLRMGREFLKRPRDVPEDRSVADLVEDHYGREVVDYLAEPLLAGIYGGDVEQLSAGAVLPKMVEWERSYGSLSRAARKEVRTGKGPLFTTVRSGLSRFVDELIARSRFERVHGCVERLEKGYRLRVNGDWIEASNVVVACRAAGVLPGLFPEIPYNDATVVALGYRTADVPHPLPGFGFLVPKKERRSLAACTWMHRKFPHRAPPGIAFLRCFVKGDVADVRGELREKMGITAQPLFERTACWPASMPQYTVGHTERVRIIEDMLRDFPGLYLAGNAYHGIGIPDCVRMGREAAAKIADRLHSPPRPS